MQFRSGWLRSCRLFYLYCKRNFCAKKVFSVLSLTVFYLYLSRTKIPYYTLHLVPLCWMLKSKHRYNIWPYNLHKKMRTDLYFIQCWTDAFKIGIWCHRRVIHWINIWLQSSKSQPWNKWFPWLKLARNAMIVCKKRYSLKNTVCK